uniref:Uncharacterized protein n=1 Tax=Odontella aurita TaxID=265563 RepID=A0A7S4MII2_9STRA|mmetsp:Transcript_22434/g.66511  ORF Transcript_22434/g.66511 Transcript_22434/m.66511 type:complete len:978 (+) Transcript_22434:183-3116(+)
MWHRQGSSDFHRFNEERFKSQVDSALAVVTTILDTTRNPRHAADEDHEYSDKYGLADFLTNTGIAAALTVLEGLGLDASKLQELQKTAATDKRTVTLRFEAEETCEFVQEKVVDVESKHEFVTVVEETKKKGGILAKEKKKTTKHKVVTKVTEYHWLVGLNYVVYAYSGNDPQAHAVVLQRRSSHTTVVTTDNKESPLPANARSTPIDTPLTWLLEHISSNGTCDFHIDRSAETCRTPRRNDDISSALTFFDGVKKWSEKIKDCFVRDVEGNIVLGMSRGNEPPSAEPEARVHLHSITDEGVFVPVLPLFESVESGTEAGHSDPSDLEPKYPALVSLPEWNKSPLLSVADVNLFLNEERRSLDEKVHKINEFFPSKDGSDMISAAEAIIVLLGLHMQSIANHFADGVDYIENMLKTQLIKAIGKEVQASDFAEYIRFHDQKLLKDEYAPKPFSYAIRRPNHYPDGVLSIEKLNSDSNEPIMSITRKLDGEISPMYFPINAATSVEFTGDRYLHAWVSHQFAGQQKDSYQLVARARQFSSFLLLVGKIAGPDSFEPLDAIILQNKDEVLVPLLLNQLPSPKDFKDAISSLSPEQQRFAKAFRQMQLESSVFAVCCIQLKPQLEALLGLPSDALTKEIKLTQDLLSLFIDYQIPSDLLSFDGAGDISLADKVAIVKGHVKSVMSVIEEAKDKDLEAAQKEADMAFEMGIADSPFGAPAPAPAGGAMFGAAGAPESSRSLATKRGGLMKRGGQVIERSMMSAAPRPQMAMMAAAPTPMVQDPFADVSREIAVEKSSGFAMDGSGSQEPFSTPKKVESVEASVQIANAGVIDFTQIPKMLDSKFEDLDCDNALCATVIKTGDAWNKKYKKNLLTKPERMVLRKDEKKSERDKAFDLLDALSRSGSLPVECAELHVIVAATHNFDHSLMQTVILDNVNPIEKMERSTLIVASTVHNKDPEELLRDEVQTSRVKQFSPGLFDG